MEEMLALKETLGLKVYNRSIGLDSSKQSKHKEFKKRKGVFRHFFTWKGKILGASKLFRRIFIPTSNYNILYNFGKKIF